MIIFEYEFGRWYILVLKKYQGDTCTGYRARPEKVFWQKSFFPPNFWILFWIISINLQPRRLLISISTRIDVFEIALYQRPGPGGSGARRTSPRPSRGLREVPSTATSNEKGGFRPISAAFKPSNIEVPKNVYSNLLNNRRESLRN